MKTPKAPDPMQTAQAQSGLNRDTAAQQQLINMTDQVNPWGSVTYDQSGTSSYVDSTGKVVNVPKFTQTTSYTPEQQAIFNNTQEAQTNISQTAADQSAWLQDYLADPFEFDNQDASDWAYDLGSQRILPQQQKDQRALESRLINQGISPGTAAWDSEMSRMSMSNRDQLNQLALTGRGQAFNEAAYTRSAPLNEISALLSGSQIANPGAQSPASPQASVGGVDYTGLVNQQYQGQLAGHNAMLGGLFGLAGSAAQAGIMASDIRVKTDISRVGTLDNGLPVYAYRYITGGPMQIGVMAQDVEQSNPAAVVEIGGIKHVNYGMAVQ